MVIKTQTPEVSLSITDTQLNQLADRIAQVLSERLAVPGNRSPGIISQSSVVTIDESIVDVGVSTKGLEKPEEFELAQAISKEDNISGAKNKLKNLKGK